MNHFEALKRAAGEVIAQHLGEPVLYHYREGDTARVCAVFSMAHVDVSMGAEVAIADRQPMVNFQRSVLRRRPMQGDLVTRRNVTYEIKAPRPAFDESFDCLLLAVDARHAASPRDRT